MWKNAFLCSLLFFSILQIQHEAKTKTEMVWTYTDEGMSGGMLKMGVLSMPGNQEEHQGELQVEVQLTRRMGCHGDSI